MKSTGMAGIPPGVNHAGGVSGRAALFVESHANRAHSPIPPRKGGRLSKRKKGHAFTLFLWNPLRHNAPTPHPSPSSPPPPRAVAMQT